MNVLTKTGFGIAASLVVCGCDSTGKQATGTVDESNQTVAVRVYLPGGKEPASGAVVQVWNPNDTTKVPATQTITAADGSYSLPSLPDGMYRVVARKPGDQLVAMQDSLYTVGGRLRVKNDTLVKAGVATGFVKMVGDDNPGSVTVVVMGTDVLVNVGRDGKFLIDNLPSGTYSLRLSSTTTDYTTTQVRVVLDFSKVVVLDTIVMNYAGIPPVNRFRALFDTLTQRIRLLWDVPSIPGVRDVAIYRENKNGFDAPIQVGVSDSGSLWDEPYVSQATNWLYTAKIRMNEGGTGRAAWTTIEQPTWKGPNVVASPPGFSLWLYDPSQDSAQKGYDAGDTLDLSSTVRLTGTGKWWIHWKLFGVKDGEFFQTETLHVDSSASFSTHRRVVADSTSPFLMVVVTAADESNRAWSDSTLLLRK